MNQNQFDEQATLTECRPARDKDGRMGRETRSYAPAFGWSEWKHVPPITPERIAELLAAMDGPIDTSEIPEMTMKFRPWRDIDKLRFVWHTCPERLEELFENGPDAENGFFLEGAWMIRSTPEGETEFVEVIDGRKA